ncbi:hypothetical protein BO79DRAFT_276435 [Aspergillus costaricaensis CBS 115574]|uniref:Uncharacterized protein n=1 Tax=Aspergillus costaricaensis CBS 115574 TaxID=1448317 RepID=A0ACD1I2D1_9EURO|nr:hypothetical protein BO79DRAFT_276435 [Aspergillus costaricaensis CBS 115574]RAK83923.1 hypothetical protein BO79DRAFT_276435 [Aspergillus costaricaensis CBS 115574]
MERKAWTGFGLDWMDGCSEWGLCTGGSGNQLAGEPLFPKSVDPLNLASGLESSCSSLSLHTDWLKRSCHVAIGQCPSRPARTVPEPLKPASNILVGLSLAAATPGCELSSRHIPAAAALDRVRGGGRMYLVPDYSGSLPGTREGFKQVRNYNCCSLYGSAWKMRWRLNFEAIRYDREAGRLSAWPDRPLSRHQTRM